VIAYPVENALFQWEEGWQRLGELRADPLARRRADRVIDAVRDELRRRIGPTFRVGELANLYADGTDWCLAVASEVDPESPLDPQTLADAAFWTYLRGASDYSGGRQLALD
jgi:hypothetical protein